MPQSCPDASPILAWRRTALTKDPPNVQKRRHSVTDKTSFTPDEWKILLEGVTMAGLAVTAAEPSGLFGLIKESFAAGTELVSAKMDAAANPLVKAIVADFETPEGRNTAREGVSEQIKGKKAAEIKNASRPCGGLPRSLMPRHRAMRMPSRPGCTRSVNMSPRLQGRVASSGSAECR
jgi:hypothetical protein